MAVLGDVSDTFETIPGLGTRYKYDSQQKLARPYVMLFYCKVLFVRKPEAWIRTGCSSREVGGSAFMRELRMIFIFTFVADFSFPSFASII